MLVQFAAEGVENASRKLTCDPNALHKQDTCVMSGVGNLRPARNICVACQTVEEKSLLVLWMLHKTKITSLFRPAVVKRLTTTALRKQDKNGLTKEIKGGICCGSVLGVTYGVELLYPEFFHC